MPDNNLGNYVLDDFVAALLSQCRNTERLPKEIKDIFRIWSRWKGSDFRSRQRGFALFLNAVFGAVHVSR